MKGLMLAVFQMHGCSNESSLAEKIETRIVLEDKSAFMIVRRREVKAADLDGGGGRSSGGLC